MSKNIYTITEDMIELERRLDALDDDSSPEAVQLLLDWMTDLTQQREDKIDGYAFVIRRLEARAKICKNEAADFSAKAKQAESKIEHMKKNLFDHMNAINTKMLVTDRFRFTIVKNGGEAPVEIIDAEQIPEDFKYSPPAIPDKDAIRLALCTGQEVPGAKLGERGSHLRIK